MDAKLPQQALHVVADGRRAYLKPAGDIAGPHPLSKHAEDFVFPGCEPVPFLSRRWAGPFCRGNRTLSHSPGVVDEHRAPGFVIQDYDPYGNGDVPSPAVGAEHVVIPNELPLPSSRKHRAIVAAESSSRPAQPADYPGAVAAKDLGCVVAEQALRTVIPDKDFLGRADGKARVCSVRQ